MSLAERPAYGSVAGFFYDLREGGRRQANVVFALIFKELKDRSARRGFFALAAVSLEPATFVLSLTVIWALIGRTEIGGVSVPLFIAVSILPFNIFRQAFTEVARAIQSNKSFYSFHQVKPIDSLIAKYVLMIALTLVGGSAVLFILWWFLDQEIRADRMLQLLGMISLTIVFGFAICLVVGTYGSLVPAIFKSLSLLGRALFFLSGVFHPLRELPSDAVAYIAWNPVAHIIELIRFYSLNIKPFDDVSLTYVLLFALCTLFWGLVSYYYFRLRLLER